MRKGAAHGTGEGEARVEGDTAELLSCSCGCRSLDLLLDLLQLRASLLHCSAHRVGRVGIEVVVGIVESPQRYWLVQMK